MKAGGTLKTSVGLLRIDQVTPISLASLSADDARLAGYETKSALMADLAERESGTLYRIDLHFEGADPRIALRNSTDLTAEDVAILRVKLARLDARGPHGSWTVRVLRVIGSSPKEKAGDLALRLGVPKDWLKIAVRKLKNLGLTISHEPGYELSPRGAKWLSIVSHQNAKQRASRRNGSSS